MGEIANRQSLAFNERGQLSQAILQFNVERTFHQRPSIARFALQHNERRVYEDKLSLSVFLSVRSMTAMDLASDGLVNIV